MLLFILVALSCDEVLTTGEIELTPTSDTHGAETVFGTDLGATLVEVLGSLGSPDAAFLFSGVTTEGTSLEAYENPDTLQLTYESYEGHFEKCPQCPPMRLDVFFDLRAKVAPHALGGNHPLGVVSGIRVYPLEPPGLVQENVLMLLGNNYIEVRQDVEDPDCVDTCDLEQCFGDSGFLSWLYEDRHLAVGWSEYNGSIVRASAITVDWSNVRLPPCEQ